MELKKAVNNQLNYYRSLINECDDAETALDMLDGHDLILAAHVIDEKYGAGTTFKILKL